MELFEEILTNALTKELVCSSSAQKIVSGACYEALAKIKVIVSNPAIDDPTCFEKIEEIVCTLEDFGIDCGGRHDFG